MNLFKEIDVRHIAIDVVVTLAVLNYFDLTDFVRSTLPTLIYFLMPLQCFLFFLMWSDQTVFTIEDDGESRGLALLKVRLAQLLTGFIMFSWLFSFGWLMIPVDYVQSVTGDYYYWTTRVAVVLGIFTGLVMMVRQFGTKVEKNYIDQWQQKTRSQTTVAERIIIPIYGFLIYGNIKHEWVRSWLGFVLGLLFLLYTEAMFEILAEWRSSQFVYLLFAIFLSYIPIRLLLVMRPPFSITEIVSAVTGICIFVYFLF